MEFTDKLMKATVSGARSVVVGGWMKEECESAALERLVRHPCLTSAIAYRQGRLAAIDELRSLTGYRRQQRAKLVSLLDADKPLDDMGFSEVLSKIECERVLELCSPRVQKILRLMMCGCTQAAAGETLGLSPSRTNQLITHDARRLRAKVWS